MKFSPEKIFNLILLGVTLVIVFSALDFPSRSKVLPLIVGVPALGLMLVQVLSDWAKPSPQFKREQIEVHREWVIISALIGFPLLIYVAGLSLGVAAFLLLFVRMVSKQSWLVTILCSLGGFFISYGLFGQLLHYPLYKGLLDII